MLRITSLVLGVPAAVSGAFLAGWASSRVPIGVLLAIVFIIGFAVAAAGWTIRRDP